MLVYIEIIVPATNEKCCNQHKNVAISILAEVVLWDVFHQGPIFHCSAYCLNFMTNSICPSNKAYWLTLAPLSFFLNDFFWGGGCPTHLSWPSFWKLNIPVVACTIGFYIQTLENCYFMLLILFPFTNCTIKHNYPIVEMDDFQICIFWAN